MEDSIIFPPKGWENVIKFSVERRWRGSEINVFSLVFIKKENSQTAMKYRATGLRDSGRPRQIWTHLTPERR